MSKTAWAIIGVLVIIFGGFYLFLRQPASLPDRQAGEGPPTELTPQPTPATEELPKSETPEVKPTTTTLKASEIAGVSANYTFATVMPSGWQAEYVKGTDAINVYDPNGAGSSNLEQSQIFIRNFKARDFQTLSTVTIFSRESLTVANQPAVRYDIEKKTGVADFPNQPSWRNFRHIVTDVRVSDASPSIFLVIAHRPDGDRAIYDQFLASLNLTGEVSRIVPPVEDFVSRVTKKPFGLYVEPDNSPVEPERFTGFHNAADAEFSDQLGKEIKVVAIADGEVIRGGTAEGYGGFLVLRHSVAGIPRAVIYGHLKPSSLPKVGSKVSAGDQIGVLGEPGPETDGERKHLHLGIRADDTIDIRGYVPNTLELRNWLDPLTLYQ